MKIVRRIMVLCLALSLVFTAYIPAAAAKKVQLNKKSVSLKVGKTAKLQIKNTKKKVKWSIKSGKKYISLQKKKKKSVVIKAKKAGTAKVLAKVGKKKLTCTVKVKKSSGSAAGKSDSKKKDDKKEVTGTPGQNVPLPAGATVFTMGTKELALGMSADDVNTVLGTLSNQEIRTGKSPQGFDTIAYNMENYQEYLLIYLQNSQVVGICGIGKTMSFSDVKAGDNGNNLNGWMENKEYKTEKKIVAAKEKKLSANEQAYAFYNALGDNTVYCIQIFNPSNPNIKVVSQNDNNMIYNKTPNTYGSDVTASIATEVGHMLNAFRVYAGQTAFEFHAGLAGCAQAYCNQATAAKLQGRGDPTLINALLEAGTDPGKYGEACYYDAADAISFANSLIELDDFYLVLTNTKEINGTMPNFGTAGVGMAYNATKKHTYVTVDYVDNP